MGTLRREQYNREYIEKALQKVEGGSLRWIQPLSLVFFAELWRLLLKEGMYDSLAEMLRTGDSPLCARDEKN
jgi:hypothetical protein